MKPNDSKCSQLLFSTQISIPASIENLLWLRWATCCRQSGETKNKFQSFLENKSKRTREGCFFVNELITEQKIFGDAKLVSRFWFSSKIEVQFRVENNGKISDERFQRNQRSESQDSSCWCGTCKLNLRSFSNCINHQHLKWLPKEFFFKGNLEETLNSSVLRLMS